MTDSLHLRTKERYHAIALASALAIAALSIRAARRHPANAHPS